jgi:CBS domain containing-hemolysin-like protein
MSKNDDTAHKIQKIHTLNHNVFYNFIKRLFKGKQHTFEESVSDLINEHKEDTSVHTEEKVILQNIITFGDREVSDVMVPRTNIIAVPSTISANELKETFMENAHSRIPIYKHSIDEIIGFIHLKDLFKALGSKKKFNLSEIIRELIYVPRTMKVTDMLTKMKQCAVHIAIVLDEYGGTDGLVTIEDIVEEVIGEINDEYDENENEDTLVIGDDGTLIVDAKTKIEVIYDKIGLKFSEIDPEYDTVGGFVITFLERIPLIGERISHPSGLVIEILDADNRKVKLLKVYKNTPL